MTMRMTPVFRASLVLALLICTSATIALAQITPSDDAYTLTSSPTVNFGAKNTLEVESSGATTFVRFDLSGIPSTVTGAMVAKATLKIYVRSEEHTSELQSLRHLVCRLLLEKK